MVVSGERCITHQLVVLLHHPLDMVELAVQVVDAPPLALVRGVVAHALVLLHYTLLYRLKIKIKIHIIQKKNSRISTV